MPAAVSRRARSTRGKANLQSKQSSTSISSFARVSKLQTADKEAAKKAFDHGASPTIEICLGSRKRKADDDAVDLEPTTRGADLPVSTTASSKRPRREALQIPLLVSCQPATSKKRKTVSWEDKENTCEVASTDIAQPSKRPQLKRPRASESDSSAAVQAEVLLERLNIQSSPPRKRSRAVNTTDRLPQELLDLVNLQTAFLKTLSLQYAHNGTNAPIDVRDICPSIAQSWGKRKVTLDDIKHCVGILAWKQPTQKATAPLLLADYGRGKICVELSDVEAGVVQEEKFKATFEQNLRLLWSIRKGSDIKQFIASLPRAVPRASAVKAAPLLSKGQRTLDEFKKEVAKKQQEKEEAKARAQPTVNADGSKMSLLDRIRFKEVMQSQAAPPPSPAELQRRSALQRADDVAGVLGMLSMATAAGRARISFTMAAVLVKLKDSLRTPISQEEGACCVRLLATEIVPQWVRVVKIGGKENVVLQTAFQPSKAAIQDQVNVLLA